MKKTAKDDTAKILADEEIKRKQNEVKYDIRDFTIGYLLQQFSNDLFYVPPYQRKFIWNASNKCRFIESVLLGLPIPMLFVAEIEEDGRLEIVDGAQRIQTLEQFIDGSLTLEGLEKLPSLNGFLYSDLLPARQRKLVAKPLRIVVLDDSTPLETRREIFDRVNTSGVRAKPSEIRRGAHHGKFMSFIQECAQNDAFRLLCPMSKTYLDHYEDEELVLRFFTYSDELLNFRHAVDSFLEKYVKENKEQFDKKRLSSEFKNMLNFIEKYFPYGFSKTGTAKTTPRVRFEAISVGVNLALRENPKLVPRPVTEWLESDRFKEITTTHASNSGPRLRARVEYVRDQLLKV